jgi:hypothetical protein
MAIESGTGNGQTDEKREVQIKGKEEERRKGRGTREVTTGFGVSVSRCPDGHRTEL